PILPIVMWIENDIGAFRRSVASDLIEARELYGVEFAERVFLKTLPAEWNGKSIHAQRHEVVDISAARISVFEAVFCFFRAAAEFAARQIDAAIRNIRGAAEWRVGGDKSG